MYSQVLTSCETLSVLYSQVLTSSLSIEQVQYEEDSNFWVGPRQVGQSELTDIDSVSLGRLLRHTYTVSQEKPDPWDILKYFQQIWTNINNFCYR